MIRLLVTKTSEAGEFTGIDLNICSYTLSPPSDSFPPIAGNSSFSVVTGSTCSWTATSNEPWITVSTGSGTGTGSVGFSLSANNTLSPRTGTITAGGQTFQVTQGAGQCGYTVSPPGPVTGTPGPGSGSFTVSAPPGCNWTATFSQPWITIGPGASGSGNGSVSYTTQANTTGAARNGTFTIAGQGIPFSQPACAYSLAPSGTHNLPAGSGNSSFTVGADSGCPWSASFSAPWVSFPSGASGSGNGAVTYAYTANTSGATRGGTFTAGTASATLSQAACVLQLNGNAGVVPASVAGGLITFSNTAGCPWAASSSAPWLTISSASSGTGSGSVNYTAGPNSGPARSGTVSVSGQPFTVSQQGNACQVAIDPASATLSAAATSGEFQVTANCPWTAQTSASFLTITAPPGGAGTGSGRVTFSVQPYTTGTQARTGVITVAGREFTVVQNPPNNTCSYALSATALVVDAAGGLGTVSVLTGANCAWVATTAADWIRVLSGSNGVVTGVLSFQVLPNAGPQRSAVLQVAGQAFTVTQRSGVGCPATLQPPAATFQSGGTAGAVVEVNSPCAWTATSNNSFLELVSGASGNGPGKVTYNVRTSEINRSGTLTIAGLPFSVTQLAPLCEFSLSALSASLPAAGGGSGIAINAAPGCAWTAALATSAPWLTLSPAHGSGAGSLRLTATGNPGAERQATIRLAGQDVLVTQQAAEAFSCTAATGGGRVPRVRAEGQTELAAELAITCSGASPAALTGDILVTFNTNFTSRPLPGASEAVLLVNNPPAPLQNVSAFLGVPAGNNAVRFQNVPLVAAGGSTTALRLANLRIDASIPNAPPEFTALVEIQTPLRAVAVRNPLQTIATRTAAATATTNPATATDGGAEFTATFRELDAAAFRSRLEEGGNFTAAPLGLAGVADSGTRLLLKLRDIPAGVRVFGVVSPASGQGVQLLAPHPEGAGVGLLTGVEQEMPVIAGQSAAAWEVLTANPAALDSFVVTVRLRDASVAQAEAVRAASLALLGPTGSIQTAALQPTPRFRDTAAAPRKARPLRIKGGFLSASLARSSIGPRNPTGSRSLSLRATLTCEAADGCLEPLIRGNLSPGSSFAAQCAGGDTAVSCQGAGRDVLVTYPRLDRGQSVTATIAAELRDDAPGGSQVDFEVTGSSDLTMTADAVQQCFQGISALPEPRGTGDSGTFIVYACGPWTLSSSEPWIAFTPPSGSGNTEIRYTAEPNRGSAGRVTTISLPGAAPLQLRQSPAIGGQSEGLRFVPLPPCRVADTRPGEGRTGAFGPPVVPAGAVRELPIPQSTCGVPATARAYSLNITVVPDGPSLQFITVWPAGEIQPLASTLNSFDGKIVANAALVPAGTNGAIRVFASNATHLIVDINGYFVP